MSKLSVIISLGMTLLFFQNCQQATEFGSKADASFVSKAELTEVDLDSVVGGSGEEDNSGDDGSGGTGGTGGVDGSGGTGGTGGDDGSGGTGGTGGVDGGVIVDGNGGGKNPNPNPNPQPDPRPIIDSEEDNELGLCVLECDRGRSTVLGLDMGGNIQGQQGVKRALCMTRKACLEHAAAVFEVKEFQRGLGVCKRPGGNPNVIDISDADLIAKILALQSAD